MRTRVGDVMGREPLLADLTAWLEPARAGHGRSVLLLGEPGIGKSTVVEALLEWAGEAGFRVGRGWCAEAGMPPYWPWRSALPAAAVGALLGADDGDGAGPEARAAVFATVVEALAVAGRERPLFIAIDDVHWADPASLRLLRTVAAAGSALPVALVLAARVDPVDVPEATRRELADLPTGLRRVPVPPLDERCASDLVRHLGGEELSGQAVSDAVSRTGGNPFFLTEVARLLARDGPQVVPAGVREAVQRRVARLPQACHAVLIAAAVAGASATDGRDAIDVEVVASACGIDAFTVVERIGDAVGAGLITVDAAGSGLLFHHALVRSALVAEASIMELGRLHRRVAEALGDGDEAAPERLAYHWSRATGPGASEQAGRWSLAAADAALRALAFEQAAAHLERALAAPGADAVGVRIRLGEAQRLSGDIVGARVTLVAAARLAGERGRADDLAVAALGLGGGVAGFEVPIADVEQVELLRRAEAGLPEGDSPLRAAVLARLSIALTGLAGVHERQRLAERAVAMADRSGEHRVTVAALAAWCDAAAGPDFVTARAAAAERMLPLAQDRVSQLLARRLALVAQLERGDLSTADAHIEAYDRAVEAGGVALLYRWLPAVWRGMRALLAGDVGAALDWADRAEEIGLRAGSGNAALLVFTLRMHAYLTAGRADEYAATTRDVIGQAQSLSLPLTYLAAPAVLLLAAGDEGPARAVLHRFRQTAIEDIAVDGEWLEGCWALAELALRLDDRAAVSRLLDLLRPYERLWVVDGIGGAVFGVVGEQLGALAAGAGRHREAVAFLRSALRSCVDAGAEGLADRIRSTLDGMGAPTGLVRSASRATIRREGKFWRLGWQDRVSTVPDGKGIRDLAVLLTRPGQPVSALELVEAAGGPTAAEAGGDLGPALDRRARQVYQARIRELDAELATAESDADLAGAERRRAERAMLVEELAGALGLGGRPRSLGDSVDRARKAVTMRIKGALRTIEATDPTLARHLRNAVKTGRMCVYEPDTEVTWQT